MPANEAETSQALRTDLELGLVSKQTASGPFAQGLTGGKTKNRTRICKGDQLRLTISALLYCERLGRVKANMPTATELAIAFKKAIDPAGRGGLCDWQRRTANCTRAYCRRWIRLFWQ